MRRIALCCCAVALVGCNKPKEEPAMESTAAMPETAAAPAPITLADVAGKWNVKTMNESGDSTLATYELVASEDKSGWVLTFPKRKPIPSRVVAVDGDSIVLETGPFESVLRKGVMVTTRAVNRLQDGKMVGTITARYAGGGADSVRMLRSEGTRAP
ncbi:MAG: hypothetical protein M3Q93_02210 [Gemmatimonadota bacterium]|nr:hypothetical protein [Gemmatimonadota bacterium]